MAYARPPHHNSNMYGDRLQPGAYRNVSDQQAASQQSYGGGAGPAYSNSIRPTAAGYESSSNSQYNLNRTYLDPSYGQPATARMSTLSMLFSASRGNKDYKYSSPKRGTSNWIKFGIPLLILVLAGAGVGGYFGWKATHDDNASVSSDSSIVTTSSGSTNPWTGLTGSVPGNVNASVAAAASAAAKQGGGDDLLYAGTDIYANPMFKPYASTISAPTSSGTGPGDTCQDTWDASSGSMSNMRPHPRIIAPQHVWDCLPARIANDAYLTAWNASIFVNATEWASEPPVNQTYDGGPLGSGILDPARDVQQRVKAWAYAYKISKDTKWMDRLYLELQTAAGNGTQVKWTNGWNTQHFLDVGELTSAFAMAYDWLYNDWSSIQRTRIMWSIIQLGLVPGLDQYSSGSAFFLNKSGGNGNWNCVTNGGLITGALAVHGDDPTGSASSLLKKAVSNFKSNCMTGVLPDGSWTETANYWYFGTNAHARAISALTTATGSDQGAMAENTEFTKTGYFHMYVSGNGGLFAYGDNGPNKFGITANQLFLYSQLEKNPLYALFQRDRADAADPLSMFWYDTSSKGAFWNGLALDHYFDSAETAWVSMRSSWTDFQGTYVAMKASLLQGHQTHGDLDVGDFVLDAMGTRWAGEYGNGNYLSLDYFSSEDQDAIRWQYYRKGTQGQNTLVINKQNQDVTATPVNKFDTTGAKQSAAIDYKPGVNDVAFFTTDMSSAYSQDKKTVVRGIRMLNGRRQILLRDEVKSGHSIEWRVQTNATVSVSSDGLTATLQIQKLKGINAGFNVNGALQTQQTMIVTLTSPGAKFVTQGPPAVREYGSDPNTVVGEQGDQPNNGVTVLRVLLGGDSSTSQVIETWWQPQWADLTDADKATPPNVPLSKWSTTSHNV